MKKGILGSMAALLAGAGIAVAQSEPLPAGQNLLYPSGPVAMQPVGEGMTPASVPVHGAGHAVADSGAPASPMVPIAHEPEWVDGGRRSHGPRLGRVDDCDEVSPYRFWASADAVVNWVKPITFNGPLFTNGATSGTGIAGSPGTTVLLGGKREDQGENYGGRLRVGLWLDKEGMYGIEGSLFILEEATFDLQAASDAAGSPLIGRSAINALTGLEAVTLVAFPDALAGAISGRISEQIYTGEANFVGSIYRSQRFNADSIIGFRYAGLDGDMGLFSTTLVLPNGIAAFNGASIGAGNILSIADQYGIRSDFYGGQIGGRTEFRMNRFSIGLQGLLAVGNTHQTLSTTGTTTLVNGAGSADLAGGILSVASNRGFASHDEFTFMPEAAARVGFHINKHISAHVGYSFLYWYNAARVADQIDRTVNPNLVPSNLAFGTPGGPNRPALSVRQGDFWAQGMTFGVEIRY